MSPIDISNGDKITKCAMDMGNYPQREGMEMGKRVMSPILTKRRRFMGLCLYSIGVE